MARKPSVWFREQDGFYYTTFRGEQTKLSRDKDEAERLFHGLHAQPPEEQRDDSRRLSVGKVCDLFLEYAQNSLDPETYKHYKSKLNRYCAHVGKGRKVADLKPFHVTTWCDAYRHWSESTRAAAIAVVLACLNWAVEQGYLSSHPLTRLKRGRYERRERILTDQERDALFAEIKDPTLRQFLRFLELTGCRPFSEAARITALDVNVAAGTITLHHHKNRKRTGKSRIIYLAPQARDGAGPYHPRP